MYFVYEKLVYPLRKSDDNHKCESTVTRLFISDDTKQHYCWIKYVSKLLSLQTSNHGHVRLVYFRCMNAFHSMHSLDLTTNIVNHTKL